jgi:hypothetical protein
MADKSCHAKVVVSRRLLMLLLVTNLTKPIVDFKKNSIEFSGFGKFVFNLPRAIKRMDKFDAQLVLYKGMFTGETVNDLKMQKEIGHRQE